jgi:hypothetical protein
MQNAETVLGVLRERRPGQPQPPWAALMARKRRKTLVVCAACHDAIHVRQPTTVNTA